jgi:hypothetical protein
MVALHQLVFSNSFNLEKGVIQRKIPYTADGFRQVRDLLSKQFLKIDFQASRLQLFLNFWSHRNLA